MAAALKAGYRSVWIPISAFKEVLLSLRWTAYRCIRIVAHLRVIAEAAL